MFERVQERMYERMNQSLNQSIINEGQKVYVELQNNEKKEPRLRNVHLKGAQPAF